MADLGLPEPIPEIIPSAIALLLAVFAITRFFQSSTDLIIHLPQILAITIGLGLIAGIIHYRSVVTELIGKGHLKLSTMWKSDLLRIFGIESTELLDGNVVCIRTRGKIRSFAFIRLTGRPRVPDFGMGSQTRAAAYEFQNLFQRLRDFITGLQKCGLPVIYSVFLHPIHSGNAKVKPNMSETPFTNRLLGRAEEKELERVRAGERFGYYKTDVLISTWIDGEVSSSINELNINVRSILASISTAFPEMDAKRLDGIQLLELIKSVLSGGSRGEALVSPEVVSILPSIVPTPSSMSAPEPKFHLPDPEKVEEKGPFLGWVSAYGRNLYKVNLALRSFPSHIAIFGITGSGKSTTASTIVTRTLDFGIRALILDWHNEYRELVLSRGGLVFTPGRDISPLSINPFDRSLSNDLSEHISLVTDVFGDVFGFTEPQSFMFMEATNFAYRNSSDPVTLSAVLSEIQRMPIKSIYERETKLALLRRLKPLTTGQAGRALNRPSTLSLDKLLNNLVSIELGHFKEQRIRKVFVTVLLKLMYDYRTRRTTPDSKHITLLEEARNVIPPRPRDSPPSIGERIIGELRKFGECIVTVAQFPSQISSEVLKNAAIRICHQVKTHDDQQLLQGAMKLTDEQSVFLHDLKPGYAIADLARIDEPFLIYVEPEHDLMARSSVSDGELSRLKRKFGTNLELEISP